VTSEQPHWLPHAPLSNLIQTLDHLTPCFAHNKALHMKKGGIYMEKGKSKSSGELCVIWTHMRTSVRTTGCEVLRAEHGPGGDPGCVLGTGNSIKKRPMTLSLTCWLNYLQTCWISSFLGASVFLVVRCLHLKKKTFDICTNHLFSLRRECYFKKSIANKPFSFYSRLILYTKKLLRCIYI
jgi:hypothetical protein